MKLKLRQIGGAIFGCCVAAAAAYAATTTLTLGTNGSIGGIVVLEGATSGSVTVQPPAVAGTGTLFQVPGTDGTNGQFLKTDGTGVTSWATPAGGGTIASTTSALAGDGAGNAVAVTGTGTNCVLVNGSSAACASGSGANPTATASDVAVNGVASTFMRSDGAPAIQKTSSSVFGLAKVDGTTITASGGVISAGATTITVTDPSGNTHSGATGLTLGSGFKTDTASGGAAPVNLFNLIRNVTGTTDTVLTTDGQKEITLTHGTGATETVLLASTAGQGFVTKITCFGSAGCSLARSGSDTFNGLTSYPFAQYQSVILSAVLAVDNSTVVWEAQIQVAFPSTIAHTTSALAGDGSGNAVAVTGTGTDCVLVNGSSGACGGTATTITPGTTTVVGATAPCLIDNSATTTMGCAAVGTGGLTALAVNTGSAGAFTKNNGDALSGTFTGTPTFSGNFTASGVPKFTGLSAGTIAAGKNLGLDSSNNLVTATVSSGLTAPLVFPIRRVTGAGAVTVSATTDYIISIAKTVPAATPVDLPPSPTTGLCYIIKDSGGVAAADNITITPNAGNIDGASTFVMNVNWQSIGLCYDGNQWVVN